MFAQHTADRLLFVLKLLAVFFLAIAILAFAFPSGNTSFAQAYLRWAAKLAIGIPLWFAAEFAGTKIFGLAFFARLSSPARIVVVTAIAVLVIVAIVFGVSFVLANR